MGISWTPAGIERDNRRLMHPWRRVPLFALVACAGMAAAQTGSSTLTIAVTLPDGAPAVGARIEVAPVGAGATRAATVTAAIPSVTIVTPPGSHRLRVTLAGFRAAEAA